MNREATKRDFRCKVLTFVTAINSFFFTSHKRTGMLNLMHFTFIRLRVAGRESRDTKF